MSDSFIQKSFFGLNNIIFILLITLIVFTLTPYLSFHFLLYILIITFLILSLILIKIIISGKIYSIGLIVSVLLWEMLEFIYKITDYSMADSGNYVVRFIFFNLFIIIIFVNKNFNSKMKKNLGKIIIITTIINVIDNIRIHFIDPNLILYIYSADFGSMSRNYNVGGTSFAAGVMLLSGILTILFFKEKSIKTKTFYLVSLLLSIYYIIFVAGRGTATILMILLLLFLSVTHFVIKFKKKGDRNVLKALILPGIPFLVFTLLNFILEYIGEDSRLGERIKMLHSFSITNISETGNDFEYRLYMVKTTLGTFVGSIKNFFIGTGYDITGGGSLKSKVNTLGIGYHSEFPDMLASYGIIGGILLLLIFFKFYKLIFKNNSLSVLHYYMRVIFFTFILYSFMDRTFLLEIGIVLILMLPLVPYLIIDKNINT